MFKVTYSIDTLDPHPEVKYFDTFDEAQDWLSEEITRRVSFIVEHSSHEVGLEELDQLFETEHSFASIERV